MFNSFDPSPFHEKDLDHDAEEYIFTAARELGPNTPFKIVIHLPPQEVQNAGPVQDAIRNYFKYRLEVTRRDLRYELRMGRIALAIGLAFLFVCITARELLQQSGSSTLINIVSEGLLISGWVAMWRPIETFLYNWWPIRRTRAVLARLATVDVELRPDQAPTQASGAAVAS